MKRLVLFTLILFALVAGIAALAIVFGGPSDPPPMASINNPFKKVDFSDLPAMRRFVARDGTKLAFRAYTVADRIVKGSVVLIHGSSARSNSLHVLAKAFAAARYNAYAPDVRGHGESGVKGHIAYVGQLEDDLEDFCHFIKPPQPATLAGFSSGGGFVLRFAGSSRQTLFSNYLLLSPFISQDAPTYRPNSGGWVSVGIPRIVAIALLNAIGVRAFNDLPVTRFALDDEAKAFLTAEYSFALASNFRPERDYAKNIRAIRQPCAVVAGAEDEVFFAARFEETFRSLGKNWPVTLVPGVNHIQLTLQPKAIAAAVAAVESMRPNGNLIPPSTGPPTAWLASSLLCFFPPFAAEVRPPKRCWSLANRRIEHENPTNRVPLPWYVHLGVGHDRVVIRGRPGSAA